MQNNNAIHDDSFRPARNGHALASLILGLISIIAWIIPLFGIPIAIIGIIMGVMGRKSSKKGMATAGLVLSIIFLLASIANAGLGAYLYMNMLEY